MVVVREAKTFYFDFNWPKDADDNFKHKIEFIRKSNECLPDNNIKKTRLNNYCSNISMETIFMNTENKKKTNEPHKFVLNLSQRLDLRSLNIHVAVKKLYIYYTWKNKAV